MAEQPQRPPLAEMEAMSARRDDLFARLQQGYQRIETGLDAGHDVTQWREFWLDLMDEYETVCTELQRDLAI